MSQPNPQSEYEEQLSQQLDEYLEVLGSIVEDMNNIMKVLFDVIDKIEENQQSFCKLGEASADLQEYLDDFKQYAKDRKIKI